jgi:hypothetical protein
MAAMTLKGIGNLFGLAISGFKSTRALAPEESIPGLSPELSFFSSLFAPEGMLAAIMTC